MVQHALIAIRDNFSLPAPVSNMLAVLTTEDNLGFLCLVGNQSVQAVSLYWDLLLEPQDGPWYTHVIWQLLSFYFVFRFWPSQGMSQVFEDSQHMSSALHTVLSDLPRHKTTIIRILGEAPMHLIFPNLRYLRKPTTGARSCPLAIWLLWCSGCHALFFVSSHLNEVESSMVYNSARYTYGICLLAAVYIRLRLFHWRHLKWMALFAAIPIFSHVISRQLEGDLQHVSIGGTAWPCLLGYLMAAIPSSMLLSFWYLMGNERGHEDMGP